jgi:dienelactone hydrolase
MSQDKRQQHISKKVVLYTIPGMERVKVRRDVEYTAGDGRTLGFDIYRPPGAKEDERTPAVVFVAGFPDSGFEAKVGCRFKEMGAYVSWARLTAASGLSAITYTNREPARDLRALLEHVRRNAADLGIDERRVGLWAASGNGPLALSVLMTRESGAGVRCAVFFYAYTLDPEGADAVADAAAVWGFVNPCAGKSVADLAHDTPLLFVRAGRDELPRLNDTTDRFLLEALGRNLPVTLVNYPEAPHAFELACDTETTREIIRRTLAFMRFNLLTDAAGGRALIA